MKEQHFVKLEGPQTQTSSSPALLFKNEQKGLKLQISAGLAILTTPKGEYAVPKHVSLNIYQGEVNGIKFHITHRVWVAKLIYWY